MHSFVSGICQALYVLLHLAQAICFICVAISELYEKSILILAWFLWIILLACMFVLFCVYFSKLKKYPSFY